MHIADRFIVGTMMFGLRASKKDIEAIVRYANTLGIREYDTSPSYIGGKSQLLLADVLNRHGISDAVIHTKLGRAYKKGLDRDYYYLGEEHLDEALQVVTSLFRGHKFGSVQIHVYRGYDELISALQFLMKKRCDNLSTQTTSLGISNMSRELAAIIFNKMISCGLETTLIAQSRVTLGLDEVSPLPNYINWAYGVLNAGAIDIAAGRERSSRYHCARDKEDIMKRQRIIDSSEVFDRIRELCLAMNVSLQDMCVAYPLFKGYDKILLGPTHYTQLQVVERLLNKQYHDQLIELLKSGLQGGD